MAQTYLKVFRDSMETHYASGIVPLMALSRLNKGVIFSFPVPIAGSETVNAGTHVSVSRTKRIKAKDSVQDATKGAGTNFTARLDAAEKVTWDTIDTVISKKRDFIVRYAKDESFDFLEDASKYQIPISDGVKNRLLEAEEMAELNVWNAGTKSATKLVVDAASANDKIIVDALLLEVRKIQSKVDDFKAYSRQVAVLVNPLVGDAFARVQGQSYQMGTNTFPDGFNESFTYQRIQFFVSPILNTIAGTVPADEVAGAIVFDTEAYKNAGPDLLMKLFKTMLLDENIAGHSYAELDVVVDPARISCFDMTLPTGFTASKKVNA